MKTRTWPVLVLGFGTLVALIGMSGLGAIRRAVAIYREVESIHQAQRASERALTEIRSGIYLSSILVRDFLLDPSHLTAAAHRRELLSLRSASARYLEDLERLIGPEEAAAARRLRNELDAYWDSQDPIFEWTPQQKLALSAIFLRRQVLPRRNAVLDMAREIAQLNAVSFKRQERRIDQSQRDLRAHLSRMLAIAMSLGLLVAVVSIYRITVLERRAHEQQERTERAEQELRRLSQQLVRAQEDERKSISRELHDEVGQMLTALRMELANLEQLRGEQNGGFQEHIGDAKCLTEQTMRAVRDLAMGLRPSMLDDLGLEPALEWQAREFSRRSGIPVAVQIDGALDELPENHRTAVYRIVQEALTNIARHAAAKNIRIALHGGTGWLALSVQDDGAGFDPEAATGRGLGLVGIEERVRELEGKARIFSQPERGTLLQVEIPLPGRAAQSPTPEPARSEKP